MMGAILATPPQCLQDFVLLLPVVGVLGSLAAPRAAKLRRKMAEMNGAKLSFRPQKIPAEVQARTLYCASNSKLLHGLHATGPALRPPTRK
jgi:hypothetical protein